MSFRFHNNSSRLSQTFSRRVRYLTLSSSASVSLDCHIYKVTVMKREGRHILQLTSNTPLALKVYLLRQETRRRYNNWSQLFSVLCRWSQVAI